MNSTGRNLVWHRIGADWVLMAGRRRTGRVVPDAKYPNMWRSLLSGGRLSDMANLSWAKDSVLAAGERELEWRAIDPSKCPEKRGVSEDAVSSMRQTGGAATTLPDQPCNRMLGAFLRPARDSCVFPSFAQESRMPGIRGV